MPFLFRFPAFLHRSWKAVMMLPWHRIRSSNPIRRVFHTCLTLAWISATLLLTPFALGSEAENRIEIFPAAVELTGRDARQQLLVTRCYPTGRQQDVSHSVLYRSSRPDVANVSPEGVITAVGSGQAEIVATLESLVARVQVSICEGDRYLPLNFSRDILPLLTKGGCNSGSCHGKSGGRGGFQLSLFGFDPRGDYDAIVKAGRGRRLFLASPEHSLLLTKPQGEVPHGGGLRLPPGDPESVRLLRWIVTGTPWSDKSIQQDELDSRLLRLEVMPAVRALGHNEDQQIVVTAIHSDGSRQDVTRLTEFRSNDSSVAEVNDHGLAKTRDRLGETAIVAIYRGQVGVCRLVVPLDDATAPKPELAVVNLVDEHVLAKLRELGVPPSVPADDGQFLRRSMLQITGQVPSAQDVAEFIADGSSDKRMRLIERLLSSSGYADFFAQKWCDILRIKRRGQAERLPATIAFHRWLRNSLAENMPFDQIVRRILTATGSPEENPAAQWYHEVRYLDRYVDDTAQVFLGVRIGCARCHNHPFENLTQQDYYGLAAFFARVDRRGGAGVGERRANETIFFKPSAEVRHPITNSIVPPHGLGGPALDIPPGEDPRQALVDWMSEPNNPYFARGLVNRLWAHFFGRGLVEPVDDLRATNPASNERLLDALSQDFVRSGFDLRHLVATICQSSTYGLSSTPNAWNLVDIQFHSRFYPQRLSAEALLDAVDKVTGIPTRYAGLPEGTRATQLPDEDFANSFLKLFGKPPRESACECERVAAPNLGQSLFLMNDSFFLSKIGSDKGFADQLVRGAGHDTEKIVQLFMTALSRVPTDAEIQTALEHVAGEEKPVLAYRNLLWALLNTKEFMYVR